jgi:hypothetical protein
LDKASFQLCDIENMAIFSHPKKKKEYKKSSKNWWNFHFLKKIIQKFPNFLNEKMKKKIV